MARVLREMGTGFADGQMWPVLDELVSDLNDLRDLVNDLRTNFNAAVTLMNEMKADFNTHTHRGDGAQAGQYNTSRAQTDAQTIVPVTTSTVVAADAAVVTPAAITLRTVR